MATKTKVQISKKQMILAVVVVALIAIAAIPSFYYYDKYQKAQLQLKNPGQAAAAELDSIIEKVGKLMILPKGETPTLATVSDKTKLAKEDFFKDAENGDKVLIYTKAKEAILYRPSKNIIVKVSPLNITDNTKQPSAERPTGKQETFTVAVYNGSTTVGEASVFEKRITLASPQLKVVAKENAASKTYKKTIVVDVNKKSSVVANQIAQIVDGEVAQLPTGEVKPKNADFLVIVGAQIKETASPSATVTAFPTIQPSPTNAP